MPQKMWVRKTTKYGVDVVMFLPNKIIKWSIRKKMLALHMILKPCAKPCVRPPKQSMVLLYMV